MALVNILLTALMALALAQVFGICAACMLELPILQISSHSPQVETLILVIIACVCDQLLKLRGAIEYD